MLEAPLPNNEPDRLNALHDYQVLDTPAQEAFDQLTRLAAYICGTPTALISLVAQERQWFKSKVGFIACECSRDIAFCAHTILEPQLLIIEDATQDTRFVDNPLVSGEPKIRFYAGVPLITPDNHAVGTICVIDYVPRQLSLEQQKALQALAHQVVAQLELRRHLIDLASANTERRQAESTRDESAQPYRSLFEDTPLMYFTVNSEAVIIAVNSFGAAQLGYTVEELLGRSGLDIVYDEDRNAVLQHFQYCLQNPTQIAHWDLRKMRKDGSVLWVKEITRIVTNPDGTQVARIVCEDITERKRTEAALLRAKLAEAAKKELEQEIINRTKAEAMVRGALVREKELSDLKSRFITTASHEFRTPLTTILSSSELLERYSPKWSEEKKLSHLKRIQVAVEQMTRLLDDVLLIGKAEAGKLEFNPLALDLVRFCHDLIEEMEHASINHKITLRTQALCPSSKCLSVCMDEKLLRHIFSNLLSNAIKYSPQDSTVDFSFVCQQGCAIFQIADRGIGIPLADQDKLFDSFHRASNVGTISGTGLGLAIVKKSVDLHGGKIEVNSEVGVGTTITVTLPLNN